jgi:hypothetical protein
MTSPGVHSSSTELFALGIEESEPWVCEDIFENRVILRKAKYMWAQLQDEGGMPTGMVRVFSPEVLEARRDSVWENRKSIMIDSSDRYSEYVGPEEYPMDGDFPRWLSARLRWWFDAEQQGVPEDKRRPFPERCETIRFDGTRCWNWAPEPRKTKRCKQHLPWTAGAELANAQVARLKLLQAAPAMADTLEDLALNAAGEAVRLKAATEILDRVGVRGGVEIDHHVEVEQVDPAAAVRERLARLSERREIMAAGSVVAPSATTPPAEEVLEAEVVGTDDAE